MRQFRGHLVRGIAFLASALLLCTVPALASAASSASSSSTAASPVAVFTAFMTAVASGNAQAAAADLASNVTWSLSPAQAFPPTFPVSASGITAVGALLVEVHSANLQISLTGTPTVSGDTVSWTGNLSAPVLTTLGVSSVPVQGTTMVTNGQIASVSIQLTATAAASLEKALSGGTSGVSSSAASSAASSTSKASASTSTTTTLPKTGQGPTARLAGLLLLGCGLLVVRRLRRA